MEKEIIELYQSTGSIRAIAKELEMSEQKVRKVLLTNGVITSETAERVQALAEKGLSPTEIAEALKVSKACVSANLPYARGTYKSDAPTKNALKIRRWREKKGK